MNEDPRKDPRKEPREDFWRGRKVLVTGHTGFKGSWLSLWLQRMGAELAGFALPPPTTPSLFVAARVAERMRSIEGDVRDPQELRAALQSCRPEIVFHLAAQALVRRSYADPVETFATNVMGTVHLLEAIREVPGVRAVVIVTSDKCYENREHAAAYREHEAMGGFDPYSSSKGCAELVTAAYRRSFFTAPAERGATAHAASLADTADAAASAKSPSAAATTVTSTLPTAIASARAGNVIGGGDWAQDRLIPDLIRAIEAQRPAPIRHPEAVRPWQHVLEPLAGYLMLAQQLHETGADLAEAWNFGPADDEAQNVRWIAERFVQLWGKGASWKLDGAGHPHEAQHLRLDSTKARTRLGWQPRWSLGQALERIVDWHQAQGQGRDMREFSLGQIAAYQRR